MINCARCTGEIKSSIAIVIAEFNKKTLFSSKLDLKLVKSSVWSRVYMLQKLGHFGKQISNTWKVSTCGVGEG
jgi:hypothetical protein